MEVQQTKQQTTKATGETKRVVEKAVWIILKYYFIGACGEPAGHCQCYANLKLMTDHCETYGTTQLTHCVTRSTVLWQMYLN